MHPELNDGDRRTDDDDVNNDRLDLDLGDLVRRLEGHEHVSSVGVDTITMQVKFGANAATKSSVASGLDTQDVRRTIDECGFFETAHAYQSDSHMAGQSTCDDFGQISIKFVDGRTGRTGKGPAVKVFLPKSRNGASCATLWGIRNKRHFDAIAAVLSRVVGPIRSSKTTMVNCRFKVRFRLDSEKTCMKLSRRLTGVGTGTAVIRCHGGHQTIIEMPDGVGKVTVHAFSGVEAKQTLGSIAVSGGTAAAVTRVGAAIADLADDAQ